MIARLLLILLFLFSTVISAETQINKDTPLNGTWDFAPEIMWTADSAGEHMLSRCKICTGPKGSIYILDNKAHKVHMYDKSGKYLKSFGSKGEGPGEFKNPHGIKALEKSLVISEFSRINYFSLKGEFIRSVKTDMNKFPVMIINTDEYIYKDQDENKKDCLKKYNIKTKKSEFICSFDFGGKKSRGLNLVSPMSCPLFTKDGNIFYGEADTCSVVQLNSENREVMKTTIKERKRKHVSREEKIRRFGKKRLESLKKYNVGGGGSIIDKVLSAIPDYDLFYSLIQVDENGFIYAVSPVPGKKIEMDIFSKEGRYIYKSVLTIPGGRKIKTVPLIRKDYALLFTEDEDGELELIKLKIKTPKI